MKTRHVVMTCLVCLTLSGCAALGTRSGWNTGPHAPSPAFYAGTVRNVKRAVKVIPRDDDPDSGPSSSLLNILEIPISLILDTIFIPCDIAWLMSGDERNYLDEEPERE